MAAAILARVSTTMKAALVGLGAISFEHLEKLRQIDGVTIAGVCDLEPTLTRAVAERFGVQQAFTDYGEMLERTAPDVVHVLTPPQSHARLAGLALEAGAHVMVEKPITPTYDEYRELRDLAADRGRMLCENYTYRFAPLVLEALDAARRGDLGEVISVDVSYGGVMGRSGPYGDAEVVHFAHGLPGGALQNFVSHPLSVAVAFMDGIERVSAWRRRLDESLASDDELHALLSGRRTCATIAVSGNAKPSHFMVRVQGTAAMLEVDVLGESSHMRGQSSALASSIRRSVEELRSAVTWTTTGFAGRRDPYFSGFRILLERFYAAAAAGGPSPLAPSEMDAVNATIRDLFAAENTL
jgi:predicted dehydrogenase